MGINAYAKDGQLRYSMNEKRHLNDHLSHVGDTVTGDTNASGTLCVAITVPALSVLNLHSMNIAFDNTAENCIALVQSTAATVGTGTETTLCEFNSHDEYEENNIELFGQIDNSAGTTPLYLLIMLPDTNFAGDDVNSAAHHARCDLWYYMDS